MQVLFDFEQVEVARGPQGTLEGAPNLGGTIHLKRRKPTGSFDVDLRTRFGENNSKKLMLLSISRSRNQLQAR